MADTQYVRGAQKIADKIRTVREATGVFLGSEVVGQFLLRRTRERFQQQVDPDGRPWAPLAASTLLRKKYSGGTKILQRSGHLYGNIALIRSRSPLFLTSNTGAGIRIGIANSVVAEYGRRHQEGDGVPQRRFLGVSRLDVRAVDALLYRAIIRNNKLT